MADISFENETFDKTNPESIYDFSRFLIGKSLHSLLGEKAVNHKRKGKGGLGQMAEELFFGYDVNSNPEADFKEAGLELKCTPLLKSKSDNSLKIKERLVCTMIDYFDLAQTDFEHSHLIEKCRLMLLLFYLHVSGIEKYDYQFLFRVLWQLPDKDLLLIKKDYDTIADKVRRGEAHLLSEGDTIYLGACRKGQKGDSPQSQPFSEAKALKRAFSLKPNYMRYILNHVVESGQSHYSNYTRPEKPEFELVSRQELEGKSFESIIGDRFTPFIGKDYLEICSMLGIKPYQSKNKYADVAGLIASNNVSKRLSKADEFVKSGIEMKTIRLNNKGMPCEAMSFKNIDYQEVFDNAEWTDSELYELFTNRFFFVVLEPIAGRTITVHNNIKNRDETEQAYAISKVFFWTMPADDLELAREYWENIRAGVMANKITADSFWNNSDRKSFHVRPKAGKGADKTHNPNGGTANKYCYWFNPEYVKKIIDDAKRI